MAKTKNRVARNVDVNDDSNSAYWTSTTPGIGQPLVITEGGHEGARAVCEYQTMAEGRMSASDEPSKKFVDYDDEFIVINGWQDEDEQEDKKKGDFRDYS